MSLGFLSKEYDDLGKFRDQARDKIASIEKTLSSLLTDIDKLSSAIDEAQEYSYSYNVKLVGVLELRPRENAPETSALCLRTFNTIGAHVKPYDIDIAHRVTPRQALEG